MSHCQCCDEPSYYCYCIAIDAWLHVQSPSPQSLPMPPKEWLKENKS